MKEQISGLPFIILIVLMAIFLPMIAIVFMLIWNSTIPGVTGWSEIDFFQSVAILLLGQILSS